MNKISALLATCRLRRRATKQAPEMASQIAPCDVYGHLGEAAALARAVPNRARSDRRDRPTGPIGSEPTSSDGPGGRARPSGCSTATTRQRRPPARGLASLLQKTSANFKVLVFTSFISDLNRRIPIDGPLLTKVAQLFYHYIYSLHSPAKSIDGRDVAYAQPDASYLGRTFDREF